MFGNFNNSCINSEITVEFMKYVEINDSEIFVYLNCQHATGEILKGKTSLKYINVKTRKIGNEKLSPIN